MNINSMSRFFKEVKVEFGRIEWPSYQEFVGSTIISLIIMFMFAGYLWSLDQVFYQAIKKIITI